MTFGEKIAQLRKTNGMTQEELGKILNVTYQAVSKWERNESLPDFITMSQIAKIFNVPLSYFEENGELKYKEENGETAESNNINYIGTCTVCGKMLKEGDEYVDNPKLVCKSCSEKAEQAKNAAAAGAKRDKKYRAEKTLKEELGGGVDVKLIISLILAVVSYVIMTVVTLGNTEEDKYLLGFVTLFVPLAVFGIVHAIWDFIDDLRDADGAEGYTRNLSLIVAGSFAAVHAIIFLVFFLTIDKSGYFIALMIIGAIISFTFVSQFLWGGAVKEIFTGGGFTFKVPGIIFALSVESILWMIIIKILLGILSALLFVVTTVLFAVVAMVGSVFLFIPSVISKTVKDKNAKKNYKEA